MYLFACAFLIYVWLPTAPVILAGVIGGLAIKRVNTVPATTLGFGIAFAVMCCNWYLFTLVFRLDSFLHSTDPWPAVTAVEVAAQAGGAAVGVMLVLAILWVWRAAERDF